VAIAINFAILQPAVAASDGLALKTTMPTAAEGTAKSAEDVARELANPNSSLATLIFKNQYRWYTGDLPGADDQNNYTMLFQPVFPLALPQDGSGDNSTIFFRPGIPLVFDQPVPSENNGVLDWDGISALGDIGFYNWESAEWTIPINLNASKTVVLGKTPLKFQLEANYYVEQPDAFGPQWMIGFNISPVVNNPFQKGFNRLIGAQ
jgi:hypothetical protein